MMELTMTLIAMALGAIGFIFGMSSVAEVVQLKRRMKEIEMIYAEDWFENIKETLYPRCGFCLRDLTSS